MAAVLTRKVGNLNGLRPLEPSRDLRGVANLIEEVFATDLDHLGRAALRELRVWSRLGPLLWWLERFGGDFSDLLSGFVWVEDGQIVGNVTVNRVAPRSQRWLISNVAVARARQGRGIGRTLMEAALAYVEESDGTLASLQVRIDNAPARHIYLSMGFADVSTTSQLRLGQVRLVPSLPLPADLKMRPHNFNSRDARRTYALARAAASHFGQENRPLRPSQFRLGLEDKISDVFRQLTGGGPGRYWAVEDENGDFAAVLNVRPGTWYRDHHLQLLVHPAQWGRLEEPLISHALNYLAKWPQRRVVFEHPGEHEAGIRAFESYGFCDVRTHVWMRRELKRRETRP
jgi:ribosomal protein S18 acetylase RimI-like enzyme